MHAYGLPKKVQFPSVPLPARARDNGLYVDPHFGKTNLADVFGTMFVSVSPSLLANNFTLANLALLTIHGLTT